MALVLNLEKSKASLQMCLQKSGIDTPPPLELAFLLDVSGSFEDEHRDGVTNDLLTRLVPWGLTFDPDKKIDVFTFSDQECNVKSVGSVTADNYLNYIDREIVDKVPGWCGATDYSYALEEAMRSFGWLPGKRPGLFGRMLGQKTEIKERKRSLVIFVTDGENSDQQRTMNVLQASEDRRDEIYFLFIGISNQGAKFPFLRKLGDRFKNTGYVSIKNLKQFVAQDDDAVNERLLTEELRAWLKS